ncbi:Rne/Rng family ribonuclease [Phycicoccus duodecadis]|uniref:Ribonuclease E n=1 Tax=Phycicoccus duodecadis TaxID=173053 RepID=A0A2N3YG35_9MICO|nr:Rne/Rng family ribonuclease [Phycicoccus duodecadis]PKW25799.1 RNAse G [Phycicoccus duodecadis]
MASDHDTTTPEAPASGALPVDAAPATDGDAGPAPRKRAARKRATTKASAPAPAPTDAPGADAPVEAATEAAAEKPAKKTARKAAKKAPGKAKGKAADTLPVEAPDGADAPVLADAPSTDAPSTDTPAAEADAPTTPRKRGSRRAKAAVAEPAAEALADPVVEPEPVAEDEDEEAAEPAATPPAVGFGLLFQAPETTVVPRRRRATAPVQAPTDKPAEAPAAREAAVDGPAAAAAPAADDTDVEATARDERDDSGDAEGADDPGSRRRRRGGRGRRGRGKGEGQDDGEARSDEAPAEGRGRGGSGPKGQDDAADDGDDESTSSRRRRRRRRGSSGGDGDDPPGTVTRVREPRSERDEPTAVKGSTRLEAKKQRRREGREAGRRRTIITEAEFLARRESVERSMIVRGRDGRTQIGVLEDGVLVEHYVSRETTASMAGNVYLGRVQNVLPSMEAAFVDIGKGRNAVLYAGEVNWDAAGLEGGQAKRIENALSSGDTVLVQVTKDPIGHKGARLTSQISLPGRYVVFVPEGSMTGISRKLPDTERARLKAILKEVVPDGAGVIVRTAAEGASEAELTADVERLTKQWERIQSKAEAARAKKSGGGGAPALLHGEPDLTIRVIRDVFTEDFASLVVSGEKAWGEVSEYVEDVAPDLAQRVSRWTSDDDVFAAHRIDEQIAKAMDRKVWLPSGGSLVIDRTEAMTVVDVNTGKFVGSGGNLEETVTKNNLEAAEEIVRQLRLRDIGGIIVIDFIDMVLEANRDLVVRRLLECLGRDRTKHQVAEVTSLGLVQMTRKRVGSGLIEVFSETCEHCAGRGIVVHTEPIERGNGSAESQGSSRAGRGARGGSGGRGGNAGSGGSGGGQGNGGQGSGSGGGHHGAAAEDRKQNGPTAAQIAAAAHAAALKHAEHGEHGEVSEAAEQLAADVAADVEAAVEAHVEAPVSAPAPEQASAPAPEPAPVQEAAPITTGRPRRKRGRVVAPAGPPPPVESSGAPDDTLSTPQS